MVSWTQPRERNAYENVLSKISSNSPSTGFFYRLFAKSRIQLVLLPAFPIPTTFTTPVNTFGEKLYMTK